VQKAISVYVQKGIGLANLKQLNGKSIFWSKKLLKLC
jgi:hypothetical protein